MPEETSGKTPPGDECLLGAGGAGGGAGGAGGGAEGTDCKLVYDEPASAVMGACSVPGASVSACLTSADCAPNYGCVDDEGNTECRPYCCGSLEDCPVDTFCDLRPMSPGDLPMTLPEPPLIPTCVPAIDCELLNPLSCTDGKACTIVRQDGTTSCVTPGTGQQGDPCPCAAGFVCSTGKNECLQLCHTGPTSECESGWKCQGGASVYPPGFGVCVEN
jgi:hypothetical protein